MTVAKTPRIGLALPNFNEAPWHDLINNNARILDALFYNTIGLARFHGEFVNSTEVTDGDKYFDVVSGIIYQAVTTYVTSAFPTTFAEEREEFPDNWISLETSSLGAASLAEAYANAPKDVEVIPGKYSARHYAETAEEVATTVADTAATALSAQSATEAARVYAEAAATLAEDIVEYLENTVFASFQTDASLDEGKGPYPLLVNPIEEKNITVLVSGLWQMPGRSFTIVVMAEAPSGYGILFSDPLVSNITVDYAIARPKVAAGTSMVFTLEEFGILGNDTGDQGPAIYAAIVAANGRRLQGIPGSIYRIETQVEFTGTVDLDLSMSEVNDQTGTDTFKATAVSTGPFTIKTVKATAGVQVNVQGLAQIKLPAGANIVIELADTFATLQDVYNVVGPAHQEIEISIAAGHALTASLVLENGDWSGYRITSEDATVPLASGFSGNVFTGTNADMPMLDCIIDAANQVSGNGIQLNSGSMTITVDGGVINVWGTGLATRYRAQAVHDGADFSGAARNGSTGAATTTWGGMSSGEGLDATDSGYYGVQAAHGAVACFRGADASGATRYGARATDAALLDLDSFTAESAGVEGVRAFNVGLVNAPGVQASGSSDKGASVTNGSIAHLGDDGTNGADFTDATNYGVYIAAGSVANLENAKLWSAGTNGLYAGAAALVNAGGANARVSGEAGADSQSDFVVSGGGIIALDANSLGGVSQQPNVALPGGMIFDPRPWTVPEFSVTANRNNYGLSPDLRTVVKLNPTAARNITGLSDGYSGARLTIINSSATNVLQIKHEDAASTDINRFSLPHAMQHVIYAGCAATFIYANSRWYLIASTGAPQMPGPYANDAAAAAGGVVVGQSYRVTGGATAWRVS